VPAALAAYLSGVPNAALTAPPVASFFDAVGDFFSSLAEVQLGTLLLGLVAFTAYLTLRSRAALNILRAAYPAEEIQWRYIWGAYMAGYGFNAVIPARGGDVVRLFLTKSSVPNSSYPAVASANFSELIFDAFMAIFVLGFAFTQGVFPKPPEFPEIDAFDISFLASNPQFTLFLITFLGIAVLVAVALLSARVKAFWARIRQGLTILRDRRRYLREVFAIQFAGWLLRCTAFWFFLEAFGIGGSVRSVLLMLGINAIGSLVPFTPQGAGIQQALIVQVFGGAAAGATVAAYSVGQQVSIAALTFGIGFASIVFLFGFRSFKEVVRRGRSDRASEQAARAG
jgi:uncharacterized membrane protein YbhN (UPF0104 family)